MSFLKKYQKIRQFEGSYVNFRELFRILLKIRISQISNFFRQIEVESKVLNGIFLPFARFKDFSWIFDFLLKISKTAKSEFREFRPFLCQNNSSNLLLSWNINKFSQIFFAFLKKFKKLVNYVNKLSWFFSHFTENWENFKKKPVKSEIRQISSFLCQNNSSNRSRICTTYVHRRCSSWTIRWHDLLFR